MRERNHWTNMVSNSAKIVNIIGAHRHHPAALRTAWNACTGKLK
jgi:hypothetical protein